MNQPETPSALEFMDGDAVQLAEAYQPTGVPVGVGAMLLMEVDGNRDSIAAALHAVVAAAEGPGLVELKTADSRSEEHTSELQSIMRISYAVFWLKIRNYK